jgi:hypothetical protein
MLRLLAVAFALSSVALLSQSGIAQDKAAQKVKNNQMVKGTVKSVDVKKAVLVVNQKVKNEVVDRELSITPSTEFVVMQGNEKKEASGSDGLYLLEGKEGSPVQVKCDKDVNVLKVTVTIKK